MAALRNLQLCRFGDSLVLSIRVSHRRTARRRRGDAAYSNVVVLLHRLYLFVQILSGSVNSSGSVNLKRFRVCYIINIGF